MKPELHTAFDGSKIYMLFNLDTDITGLDREIMLNTLDYSQFIASMADDYAHEKSELEHVAKMREKFNLYREN